MQYFIFITCGTSALTNPARRAKDNGVLQNILIKNSNAINEDEIEESEKTKIQELINQQTDYWAIHTFEKACTYSAEMNCLINWLKQNNIKTSDCYCYLIHSNTVLGFWAAQFLEDWLVKNNFLGAELKPINISTSTKQSFQTGLSELAKWAFETIPQEHSSETKYIFNIAGGFKSVSGFMQVLGQFLADETIYQFEGDNTEILSMPKLPVKWDDVDSVRKNFNDYHRVALGIPPQNPESLNSLWFNELGFTPWGQIAWESAKQIIYSEKIQDFVYPKVQAGSKFFDSVRSLDPFRNKIVNERLDDLCVLVLSNKQQNIRRLDYKVVKGNHPYSHECDAWADGSAKRLFCNEVDGGKIIVECLDKALH